MNKRSQLISLLVIVNLFFAGCAPTSSPTPASPADKLAEIVARGTLVIATDPAYPPQSELKKDGVRAANTKCGPNEHTASEFTGFDVDTAIEIARRLGVEPCFVTPAWTQITAGSWADHWDISFGSMTITAERMEGLYFTQPYYASPAVFFVHRDNTAFAQLSDLSGKRIGSCAGCTFERYLEGSLTLPGQPIEFAVKDANVIGYDNETTALQDLTLGDGTKLDAVLTQLPTGQAALAAGSPIKQLGGPAFFAYAAAAIDKKSSKDSVSFAVKVAELIRQLHADGTLSKLSQHYHGLDLTTAAGQFDLKALGQLP